MPVSVTIFAGGGVGVGRTGGGFVGVDVTITVLVGRVAMPFSISWAGPRSESQFGGSGSGSDRYIGAVVQPARTNAAVTHMNQGFNTRPLCE